MRPPPAVVLAGLTPAIAVLAGVARAEPSARLPVGVAPVRYELSLTPDAARLSFLGEVRIALSVARPMDAVTLNAADLTIARATLDGRAATVTLDTEAETARFSDGRRLAPGSHVLSVVYAGKISQRPAGLFVVDYPIPGGSARMLSTQFEPADARRVLPCFDEPAYKAAFTLTAVVPSAWMAVSNMPVAAREPLAGGLTRVRFQPTPKMSSYLLYFGEGDLERTTRRVDGIEVGVVTPQGQAAQARFALDAATRLLAFYDGYFGVRYPLPKLDLIAAPGEVGGAMENWGAILFSQRYIAVDSRLTPASEQREVFDTVAHEMAHQWFGDLVTMNWWDDLWLNEGFATWMATKATQRFHPEWRVGLEALVDKDSALTLDARVGAHPIVQPVESVAQAEQAFDDITYLKGAAVIHMLEGYVGEDAFRAGVRTYIGRHAYANARTDALWSALDRAAGRPVSPVARDFTTLTGAPVVRVSQAAAADGVSRLSLKQGRFQEGGPPQPDETWRIPLRLAPPPRAGRGSELLLAGAATAPGGDAAPMVVNAGQGAYARTAYAPALMTALTKNFAALAPADQLGLMLDSAALGRTGEGSLGQTLELVAALPANAEPVVLRHAVNAVLAIGDIYPDEDKRLPAFKAWALRTLAPWWARIGFDARPGEPPETALLRERLITGLGRLDDPEVLAEVGRRFDAFRMNPAALPAPIRRAVLRTVARHADAARFDQLHALARAAPTALEKEQLYSALATVEDDRLAPKVLEIAVGAEPPAHFGPVMVGSVAAQQPDLAWTFAVAHADALQAQVDALQRTTLLPGIAEQSSEPARAAELESYAAAHYPADARKDAARAAADIRWKAEVRAKRLPDVTVWIAAHG